MVEGECWKVISLIHGHMIHSSSFITLYRLTVLAHVGCESIRDTCELVQMYIIYILYMTLYIYMCDVLYGK